MNGTGRLEVSYKSMVEDVALRTALEGAMSDRHRWPWVLKALGVDIHGAIERVMWELNGQRECLIIWWRFASGIPDPVPESPSHA